MRRMAYCIVFAVTLGIETFAQCGTALETEVWQTKIDETAEKGGGVVIVPSGRHLVGQLELKSNVELHLEDGAVLEGACGMGFYHPLTLPYSEGVWAAVVSAVGVTNVAITGRGLIDGRGGLWPQPQYRIPNNEGHRPRGILFADCLDVRLEDFKLRDAACWGIVFKRCTHVRVRRVMVDNHANANNDGFDIEAWDAVFDECTADSGDDAFCFKSNDPNFKVGNIVVRNSLGRSQSNCYKLGTATHGVVKGIRIENCRATLASRDFISTSQMRNVGKPFFWRETWSERYPNGVGKTALAIQNVDGGDISDIVVDGFSFDGYLVPFCIRGGRRQHRSCDIPPNDLYRFHDISIAHVRGKALTSNPSWIVGVDGCRVKNVTMRDVEIECVGEGRDSREITEPDEGLSAQMPMAEMFTDHRLPAYGLYIDKADGVTLENVRFPLRAGTKDARPATYDSRTDAKIAGLVEPKAPRNLKGRPEWDLRFRTLKSTGDGTTQPFYWYDPGREEPVPLIVALHSWGASCHWNKPAESVCEYCRKHGWAMLYPNFRGPNIRPEACGSDLAVQDILDTIAWAKTERKIDADRVYIIGGSGGGYMTLLMAGRFPEVFAGAAAFCPITDLARWHADSTLRKNHYAGNIAAACGGLPDECQLEYQKRSALTYMGNARANKVPIYIVTGIHDGHTGSVPVGHAIRAYNALADGPDRISEADIAYIEEKESVPDALRFNGNDPFYDQEARIHFRATSANVRLTLFEAGHNGNYPAGLDFLSRQVKGRAADMTLPERSDPVQVESITK